MTNKRARTIFAAIALAFAVGAITGAVFTWIAIQHNPQGEFIDTQTGAAVISNILLVFGSWFILAFLVTIAAQIVIYCVYAAGRKIFNH